MAKAVGPIMGPVASVLGMGSSSSSSAPSAAAPPPPPPPIPAPAPMPTMDTDAVLAAQKRQAALATASSGRASTILSSGGSTDKLGG